MLLALSSILLSCTQSLRSFLSPEEQAWLEEHEGEIEVLFGYELPPDAFTNNLGQYTGLLVDYLHEIEHILGFHFPMKIFSTWHELLEYSKTGRDFIIVGLSNTEPRDVYLDFTSSFQSYPFSIVSRTDRAVETVQEFLEVPHCTVKGYAIDDFLLEDYPDYHPSHVITDIEGVTAVSKGEYDALFSSEVYANYLISREGIKNLTVSGDTGYFYHYSMAVPEGEEVLLSIIQKAQDRISSRRHKEINRHWNNVFAMRISSDTWNVLFFSILGLLGLVLIILLWVLTLKQEVRRKTMALRENGERYRILAESRDAIIRSMTAGVFITDPKGIIREVNPAMERLSGMKAEELIGLRDPEQVFDFPNREEAEDIRAVDLRVRSEHKPMELRNTISPRTRDGREMMVMAAAAPAELYDGKEAGTVWILRDVSSHIRREREILEADKAESLKVLAGGISHDFNNLLTGIYGFVNLASTTLHDTAKAGEFLEKAVSSLDDARSLSSQLSSMARGGAEKRSDFSPAAYIRDTAVFSHRSGGSRLKVDISDDLWPIHADKGQLGQVISNLVINAQQALGSSGEISVRGRNIRDDAGAFIEVCFEDDGPGIPPEIQGRIFDPYFTTKKTGSGLGLASCSSIVSRHNGTLSVASEPGRTVFTVRLPAIDTAAGSGEEE